MNKKQTPFMSYEEFMESLEMTAGYETIYEDSEGRDILVIEPINLFAFIDRLFSEHETVDTLARQTSWIKQEAEEN
jgi:hypothetical protein